MAHPGCATDSTGLTQIDHLCVPNSPQARAGLGARCDLGLARYCGLSAKCRGFYDARRTRAKGREQRGWRRGRDSNPRYGYPYAAFRVRCFQPLSHLSVAAKRWAPAGRALCIQRPRVKQGAAPGRDGIRHIMIPAGGRRGLAPAGAGDGSRRRSIFHYTSYFSIDYDSRLV